MDWSPYAECGYNLKFIIRGSIKGVQREVKDKKKIIDSYIQVIDRLGVKIYSLKGFNTVWKDVEELHSMD